MAPRLKPTAKIMHRAAELRRGQTPAEAKLWAYLRSSKLQGIKFRRQHAIGRYIVDFCAPGEKLVIELDGSQHLGEEEHDQKRTKYLESMGYRVIRFWNDQVMIDIAGVIKAIAYAQEPGGDTHS